VANIESTPVVGVVIRKESTAPLLAPSFFKEVAAGMTEQEQRGKGIPKKEDFKTERKSPFPRCLETKLVLKKI
jgi:hypothetical protein